MATFLQPRYGGPWFDGVRFLSNGQVMSEMDHVDLSGVFLRDIPPERYAPVPGTRVEYPLEYEIVPYLRATLELGEEAQIQLLRLRAGEGRETIVFFVAHPERLARRGVLEVTDGRPRVLRFEEDPCYCQSLAAEVIELAAGHDRFVLTRFSPITGSCVGLDVVRILTVGQEGALEKVWSGTTFEGNGSRSEIATVEFIDRDGDADLEIVRRGRVIDCGDDCPCRDGPVLATFETVFDWDGERGRFVEVP